MAYCRFSSDNFKSDVYCYEDCCGGYTLHIASNRVVTELPKLDGDNLLESYKAQHEALETAERTPIGLPFDGETVHYATLDELLQGLLELRHIGYTVPEYALETIREELKE